MAEREPIGQLLDSLGVGAVLDEGDMVTDAVVVMKVVQANGTVAVTTGSSEALSWLDRLGMVTVAAHVLQSQLGQDE